jgi:hypothetical protein
MVKIQFRNLTPALVVLVRVGVEPSNTVLGSAEVVDACGAEDELSDAVDVVPLAMVVLFTRQDTKLSISTQNPQAEFC